MSGTPKKAADPTYKPPSTAEMRKLIQPSPPPHDRPESIAYHREPTGSNIIKVKP